MEKLVSLSEVVKSYSDTKVLTATIPSWIRLRNMNLGNLVRSIER